MGRLLENITKKEAAKKAPAKKAAKVITTAKSGKDKQISAKVNAGTYAAFTKINEAQGMSNNSVLNMLISKYVRENREIIEEELAEE